MSQTSSPTHQRRRGHHSRSTAVLSSTSSANSQFTTIDTPTTTINASATSSKGPGAPASNPLLQPDVTPADLFTQYTPPQIEGYLASIKAQLQTYDAELKALINTRYEDILSVGNTISSMRGSSINLSSALTSVGDGLRKGLQAHQDRGHDDQQEEEDEVRKLQRQEQERVRYVAALLLILQEAPEEIWRILDTAASSHHRQSEAAPSDSAPLEQRVLSHSKLTLRTVRRLALAISLFDAVRITSWELNDMPENVKALFTYPISQLTPTLNTVRTELRGSIETALSNSSFTLSSYSLDPTTAGQGASKLLKASVSVPAWEAAFRSSIISLMSLTLLSTLQASKAASHFLELKKARLQQWLRQMVQENADAGVNCQAVHAIFLREIAEVCAIHSRIFAKDDGSQAPLFYRLLSYAMSNRDGDKGTEGQSPSTPLNTLSTVEPISAVMSLPSGERISAAVPSTSTLRTWKPYCELPEAGAMTADAGLTERIEEMLQLWSSEWSQPCLDQLKTTPSVAKLRKELAKVQRHLDSTATKFFSGPSTSADAADGASSGLLAYRKTMATVYAHLQTGLKARGQQLWTKNVVEWRESALEQLEALLAPVGSSGHSLSVHRALFLEDFATSTATSRSASRAGPKTNAVRNPATMLSALLEGRRTEDSIFFNDLLSAFVKLQKARRKYFEYMRGNAADGLDDANAESSAWQRLECEEGWQRLAAGVQAAVRRSVEDMQAAEPATIGASEGSRFESRDYMRVLALTRILRSILKTPSCRKLIRRSFEDDPAGQSALVRELRETRQNALLALTSRVVAEAGRLWLGESGLALLGGASSSEGAASHFEEDAKLAGLPSAALLRALTFLDEQCGQMRPSLVEGPDTSAGPAAHGQDESDGTADTMGGLVSSLLFWAEEHVGNNFASATTEPLRQRFTRDLDYLALILSRVNVGDMGKVDACVATLRKKASPAEGAASAAVDLAALSAHGLLLGQLDFLPLPSSSSHVSTPLPSSSLLENGAESQFAGSVYSCRLAEPSRGRILGVTLAR